MRPIRHLPSYEVTSGRTQESETPIAPTGSTAQPQVDLDDPARVEEAKEVPYWHAPRGLPYLVNGYLASLTGITKVVDGPTAFTQTTLCSTIRLTAGVNDYLIVEAVPFARSAKNSGQNDQMMRIRGPQVCHLAWRSEGLAADPHHGFVALLGRRDLSYLKGEPRFGIEGDSAGAETLRRQLDTLLQAMQHVQR